MVFNSGWLFTFINNERNIFAYSDVHEILEGGRIQSYNGYIQKSPFLSSVHQPYIIKAVDFS